MHWSICFHAILNHAKIDFSVVVFRFLIIQTYTMWIWTFGILLLLLACYVYLHQVLAAEKRMWLTYLKGNYWGASLSMPLTDNQLIILLIIYSSPHRLFSVLLAVSLKQSAETFNGLAGSWLW